MNLADHVCLLHGLGRTKDRDESLLNAEWHSVEAVKQAAETPLARFIASLFQRQLDHLLGELPDVLANFGVKQLEPFTMHTLIPDDWEAWVESDIGELIERIMNAGYQTGGLRLDVEIPTFRAGSLARDVLLEVVTRTRGINRTTRDEIAAIIETGLDETWTIEQMADRIQEQYSDWQGWRAQMVAQTAATPTFEVAQLQAYADAGIGRMGWLSRRDGRVRETHRTIDFNQEIVKIGDPFSNGCRFPGDPLADAKEVIQCRCSTLPQIDDIKSGIHNPDFNEREKARIDLALRDYSIRTSYPQLRDRIGQAKALAQLADEHNCSESTVRSAVYG